MFIQLLLLLAGLGSQGNLPESKPTEEPVLSEDSQQQVRYALGNNKISDYRYFGGHGVAIDWLNPPRSWVPEEYAIPRHWGIHGHGGDGETPPAAASGDRPDEPTPAPLPPDNNPSPDPTPVPEPATLALLGLGSVGALLRRRRTAR
ncbi:MAG: PEP-CTERM sorting domain-containing protein [Phycisphaerae bacterium]